MPKINQYFKGTLFKCLTLEVYNKVFESYATYIDYGGNITFFKGT